MSITDRASMNVARIRWLHEILFNLISKKDEEVPYLFFVDDLEITSSLADVLNRQGEENVEKVTFF